MAERIQMFERRARSQIIVHDYRADIVIFQFASHNRGGNVVLLEIGKHVDVDEQPVGENDEPLDAAVQQHFEIAFEAASLVVYIRKYGKKRRLVKRVLDATQHQRAVWISHVENHDADGLAAPSTQRARKQVGTVA